MGLTTEQFREINAKLQEEFSCDHLDVRLARRVAANGAVSFPQQCRRCGQCVRVVKSRDLTDAQKAKAIPYDETLQKRWWDLRSRREIELRDAESREWWAQYDAYLKTPSWHARRALVLKRANGVCEGCGQRRATQVHHLTYERVGQEMLFDLVAVCDECHETIHSDRT